MRVWARLIAVVVSSVALGSLLTLGFGLTTPTFHYVAIGALGMIVAVISWTDWSWWRRALYGIGVGLGLYVPGLYWVVTSIHEHGHVAYPIALLGLGALALVCAFFWALAFILSAWISPPKGMPRLCALIGLMVLAEWLRGTGVLDFGWLNLGYLGLETPLAGYARVGGVYGVLLVLLLVIALALMLIATAFDRRKGPRVIKATVLTASLVGLVTVGWQWYGASWSNDKSIIHVEVIQPNLPVVDGFTRPDPIGNLVKLQALLDSNAQARLEKPRNTWVLFPEGSLELYYGTLSPTVATLQQRFIRQIEGPLLTSGLRAVTATDVRNSATFFFENSSTQPRAVINVDKRKLVPFGETVPQAFQWIVELLKIPMSSLTPGAWQSPLWEVGPEGVRPGVLICYENIDGDVTQSLWHDRQTGPNVLIVTANLGWFGPSINGQHLQMSQMRALEVARPLVSVSNNGLSAYLNSKGQILKQLPMHQARVADWQVQTMSGQATPFVRWGNYPALMGACFFILVASALGRSRRKKLSY